MVSRAGGKQVRIGWLDTAQGLAILIVVLGHVLGGLIDSPVGSHAPPMRMAFLAIYSFHMPVFFLLSGLLVEDRLARGRTAFLSSLVPTIIWPYFLWSVVQLLMIYSIGSLANRPVQSILPGLTGLPWKPVSQFWFLYALFWMHVAATLLTRRLGREGFVLMALAVKSLALVIALPLAVRLVTGHMLFYAIGLWLGAGGVERLVGGERPVLRALLLSGIAVAVIAVTMQAAPAYAPDIDVLTAGSPALANVAWRFPALAAAIAGVMALLAIATAMGAGKEANWLAWLGRRTMPIYLMHILFIAGGRIALVRLGMGGNPYMLASVLWALGLVGPLVAYDICLRLRVAHLLGLR